MKQAIFHPRAREALKSFPANVRKSIGKALLEIQKGANLFMAKSKFIRVNNAMQLAKALGLSKADAMEMEFRSTLNDKIIETVREAGLTHAQVARLAGTSRTRITAILNRNTHEVSTDLLLRILANLGIRAKISFLKAA